MAVTELDSAVSAFEGFISDSGELEFYFRKIPLHQQKFLVVLVLSNSLWLPRNLKHGPK